MDLSGTASAIIGAATKSDDPKRQHRRVMHFRGCDEKGPQARIVERESKRREAGRKPLVAARLRLSV